MEISSLKVVELRAELEKRGLPTKGLKKDLVKRLTEAIETETEEAIATKEETKETDNLEKEEKEDKLDENASSEEKQIESKGEETDSIVKEEFLEEKLNAVQSIKSPKKKKDSCSPSPKKLKKDDHDTEKTTFKEEKKEIVEEQKELIIPANATNTLFIQNLVRPFSSDSLKEYIGQHGEILFFWINSIKSHCFAKFGNEKTAFQVKNSIHGIQWPKGGKHLSADFITFEHAQELIQQQEIPAADLNKPKTDMATSKKRGFGNLFTQATQAAIQSTVKPQTSHSNSRKNSDLHDSNSSVAVHHGSDSQVLNIIEDKKEKLINVDLLFRKTLTKPHIYYKPLDEEQVALKKKQRIL